VIRFTRLLVVFSAIVATLHCGPRAREYPLRGQIIAVNRETTQLTIRHEDIPGLMPGMVMSFKLANPQEIGRYKGGELVTATLVVRDLSSSEPRRRSHGDDTGARAR
jgi:Cu/Ag efflux protein CusF